MHFTFRQKKSDLNAAGQVSDLLRDSRRGVVKQRKKKRMREVVIAPQWLTVKQTAEYMQVSTDTVEKLIAEKALVATYFSQRTRRINRDSIEALAKKNLV